MDSIVEIRFHQLCEGLDTLAQRAEQQAAIKNKKSDKMALKGAAQAYRNAGDMVALVYKELAAPKLPLSGSSDAADSSVGQKLLLLEEAGSELPPAQTPHPAEQS